MFDLKSRLTKDLAKTAKKTYPELNWADFDFSLTIPPSEEFGDFSSNLIFKLTPLIKEDSRTISQKIIPLLWEEVFIKSNFFKIEVAGSGFINFFLKDEALEEGVKAILAERLKFSQNKIYQGQKIQIEFISANPTGPIHIGNGRGGFIGDVLANVLVKSSGRVAREYYVNDQGSQIEKLGHSVMGDALAVYQGDYINRLHRQLKATTKSQAYPVGKKAAKIILADLIKKTVQEKMKIKFDKWFLESSLYAKPNKVKKIINKLKKEKYIYEQDGAWWFRSTQFGDDKDRVVIKKDGEPTYLASDFAYHENKFKRGFKKLINIWGADHHGDLKRIQGAVEVLGHKGQLDIIITQMVHLLRDGQEVKMSKRTGTYLTVDEVVDEVGHDNARFFFLMQSADSHLNFDLNLAKEKNEKNPVFYAQYAYARLNSLFQKVKNMKKVELAEETSLKKEEREFIKELLHWPQVLEEVATDYQVQKIPFYAIALANRFHSFYDHCRVLEDGKVNLRRLGIMKAAAIIFKDVFNVLGIQAPEKM